MKVKCINNENCFGVLTKGKVYEVLAQDSANYKILDDLGLIKWFPKKRFEVVKEESTIEKAAFKGWEIIKMCEEGKIKNGTILQDLDGEHFTVFNGVIIDGEREKFDSNYETTSSFFVRNRFRIIKKEYTFEEAFKAYKEGKEIESCEGDFYKYKRIDDSDYVFIKDNEHWLEFAEHEEAISFNEIRGKWYIND